MHVLVFLFADGAIVFVDLPPIVASMHSRSAFRQMIDARRSALSEQLQILQVDEAGLQAKYRLLLLFTGYKIFTI